MAAFLVFFRFKCIYLFVFFVCSPVYLFVYSGPFCILLSIDAACRFFPAFYAILLFTSFYLNAS